MVNITTKKDYQQNYGAHLHILIQEKKYKSTKRMVKKITAMMQRVRRHEKNDDDNMEKLRIFFDIYGFAVGSVLYVANKK